MFTPQYESIVLATQGPLRRFFNTTESHHVLCQRERDSERERERAKESEIIRNDGSPDLSWSLKRVHMTRGREKVG